MGSRNLNAMKIVKVYVKVTLLYIFIPKKERIQNRNQKKRRKRRKKIKKKTKPKRQNTKNIK